MKTLEKIALLLTLMQQLHEVMTAETEAVRQMQLARLGELQEEKRQLADRYERELLTLRREPEAMAALPLETRQILQDAMRDMQQAIRRNMDMLAAAKIVAERLLRRVAEGIQAFPSQSTPPVGGGRVIAFALDQQL